MKIFCSFLMIFGLGFLFFAIIFSINRAVAALICVGIIFILVSHDLTKKAGRGKPAPSLEVLVTGEKYEVVTIYEKYIIIKSATDDGLKFIGPLDFGTRTIATGRYVKTAEESLEKIE